MEQAKSAAAEDGMSVNQMLLAIIAEGLGNRRGLKMIKGRASRADIAAAFAILERVPKIAPDDGDEIAPRRRNQNRRRSSG
jgi:hypothetical protein